MKKNQKYLSLLMLATLLVGCKNTNTQTSDDINTKPAESGINLVDNCESSYRIVYEKDAPSTVIAAASELSAFIQESSTCELSISSDTGEEFNPDNKVISLGNTKIYEGTGLEITEEMHKTGYYLKRFGNTVVINAKDGNGVMNGVYDMLNYLIDLEFYSEDEFAYEKYRTIPLLDFDITHIPYIDVRDVLEHSLNKQYRRRLRFYTGEGTGQWITFAHTVITTYLPVGTYGSEHPDWYNGAKSQVCYANEEMRHEMAKRIEQQITSHPGGQYVMIGHEDNWDMCNCSACVAERDLYGGYGGQELHFTNELSKEVDSWLADNEPGREVEYVFFAYQTSQTPPVKTERVGDKEVTLKDSEGYCIPAYDNFNIRKNVIVIYCPIDADFSIGFSETENTAQYEQLVGWSDIFHKSGLYNNILIWSYSLAPRDYMVPFNNFGALKDTYKFYKNLGACYVMDQSTHDSSIPCFEALKLYTQGKLMYNNDLDYNELVDDFMVHYYGEASESFKDYYYFIRSHYRKNNVSGSVWQTLSSSDLWSLETLDLMMSYFDNCFKDIEPLRESDELRFNVLNDRLRRERLTPIYLLLKLYFTYLTQEQKEEYIVDFEKYTKKFDINETGESQHNMENLIAEWKNSIYGY